MTKHIKLPVSKSDKKTHNKLSFFFYQQRMKLN